VVYITLLLVGEVLFILIEKGIKSIIIYFKGITNKWLELQVNPDDSYLKSIQIQSQFLNDEDKMDYDEARFSLNFQRIWVWKPTENHWI
jgi:hypothetical protein